MINKIRHILLLLIIYFVLLISGVLLINAFQLSLSVNSYVTIVTVMTVITLGSYLFIRVGIKRGEKERGIFLLAGLGGKFLAYLILIGIYWATTKNLSMEFIIAFFVLYLAFTIFLVGVLYKALKIK